MVVCCWNAPFPRFDRSAYTSESGGGRRISETVNPAGFPWITTRELSVWAANCAASSATGPVGGGRSAGGNDLPSPSQNGRGAGRGRGEISGGARSFKKKKKKEGGGIAIH